MSASLPAAELPTEAAALPPPGWRRLRSMWRRWFLWVLMALLVMGLLITVVWLAGRHEIEQVQQRLERDTADATSELRSALARNLQSLQATDADPQRFSNEAAQLLRGHREWLRIERRDASLVLQTAEDTPYRPHPLDLQQRPSSLPELVQACTAAERQRGGAYAPSHYLPLPGGGGIEVLEVCLPSRHGGYLIALYSLRGVLSEMLDASMTRGQEVSLLELDGTRLASIGTARRAGNRVFTAQQALELPGLTLMLRVDGWRSAPDLFPNLLTGLVTAMSIALVSVLVLLARDTRRRLRVEHDLSNTLAFRKAMEDSVLTGLRARDLDGRVTYVNAAFCDMVGFTAEELLGRADEMPYWPPELAAEYRNRQHMRQASGGTAREGYESVFRRKDGSRFPVLIFETPLIDDRRVQTGWMSAIVDLSEQRRIEEMSRASQERLQATARLATVGEMASLLSHELNQPLAAIASYATGSLNLLESPPLPGQEAEDRHQLALAMRRIAEQAERAGRVIRSVHDFVRRRERAREPVTPLQLFEAVMPLVQLQARKLDVRVELKVPANLPPVLCDRSLVEQVLLNLARNGMQAMDRPELRRRVLTLGAELADGGAGDTRRWIAFSVADEGCGIDAEVQERLFTPFFTTRRDGMGLGLSLCRTVVEQHGGALGHAPNRPRGTVFRFTLPTGRGEAAPLSF